VGVDSSVSNQYWACKNCKEKSHKESTPKEAKSVIDSSNNHLKVDQDLASNISLIDLTSNNMDPLTSERECAKSTKSQKSGSSSSRVSRRTALALQRLEEERELRHIRDEEDRIRRENEDKKYLDEKYSLLEGDSDNDSSQDKELETTKRASIQKWAEDVQKEGAVGVTEVNVAAQTSEGLNPDKPVTRTLCSLPIQPKIKRLNRSLSSFVRIAKASESALPLWLTAPAKLPQDTPPTNKHFLKTPIDHICVRANTTKAILPVTSGDAFKINNSETSEQFQNKAAGSFMPWPSIIATNVQTTAVNTSSEQPSTRNSHSANALNVITQANQFNAVGSNYPRIPKSFAQANHWWGNQQASQPFPSRTSRTLTSHSNLVNNQTFSFGQQSIPGFSTHQTSSGQFETSVAPQTDNSSMGRISMTSTSNRFENNGQQIISPISINSAPVMTTTFANYSAHNFNSNPSFPPSQQNLFGQTSGSPQVFAESNHNDSVSRRFGNGIMPAATNIMPSTSNVKLTAEQIAARHVIPKLPHFFGDPKYWQGFISAFEYSTKACGFSNVENLGRLQDCIRGDAKLAVGSRLLHPDSVPPVINTLKLLYGRPELIIESMIEEIKKESSPRDDDLAGLIKFAISVQNLCGTIRETGAVEHLRNPTLMNTITDKLPTQTQPNRVRHVIGSSHKPSIVSSDTMSFEYCNPINILGFTDS